MRILLIDDDDLSRKSISSFLQNYAKYEVVEADNCEEGLFLFSKQTFPVVISDIRMPGMNGIELLKEIKKNEQSHETDVILITGFGDMETSVQALREGAFDYLIKPINVQELFVILTRIEQQNKLKTENRDLKENLNIKVNEKTASLKNLLDRYKAAYAEVTGLGRVGFFSDKMKNIVKLCETYHRSREISILIDGETGTGKEVISSLIHYGTSEKNLTKPFITINCSAITPTLFESELFGYEEGAFTGAKEKGSIGKLELAQGGTLFLDEIGDMPLDMQPKLLRVLQDKKMYRIGGSKQIKLDVRFIFATNKNLEELCSSGTFRKDLYFRINTGHITIQPLREHKEDIMPLANMFLEEFNKKRGRDFNYFHQKTISFLMNYSWPGNIRELRSTIERISILYNDSIVKPEHITFLNPQTTDPSEEENELVLEFPADKADFLDFEKLICQKALKLCNNNKTKTAQYLNISRNTLSKKLK